MARILVVDDETEVRQVIVTALRREGHSVRDASNGLEATRSLEQESPDLVITDILMPERDGFETIMALQGGRKTIPVIAMSGAGDQGPLYLKVAKGLGAVRLLAKPFSIEELVTATNEALGGQQQSG
jgi:CheY-like chemotaxis protein